MARQHTNTHAMRDTDTWTNDGSVYIGAIAASTTAQRAKRIMISNIKSNIWTVVCHANSCLQVCCDIVCSRGGGRGAREWRRANNKYTATATNRTITIWQQQLHRNLTNLFWRERDPEHTHTHARSWGYHAPVNVSRRWSKPVWNRREMRTFNAFGANMWFTCIL